MSPGWNKCPNDCAASTPTRKTFQTSTLVKSPSDLDMDDVLDNFPSPSLREYQKEIVADVVEAFKTGKRCFILAAPTGFGKSYVNAAFCSVTKSFYATPQLVLIDQILRDPFLRSIFVEIKGRQNYWCYHQPDRSVDAGRCVTEDYTCERFRVCRYWIQKMKAINAQSVLLSFAYLIAEGQTEGQVESSLGRRSLLILDEAHNIEEQCLNQISVRVDPFTIPWDVYNKLLPQLRKVKTETQMKEFLQRIKEELLMIKKQASRIAETTGLSVLQAEDLKKIERFISNHDLYDSSKTEWIFQVQNDKLMVQPVFAKQFMKELVWKRAEYYIISSATILDPQEYVELTGLRDMLTEDEICFLDVPSTVPVQNRPIIDMAVGPLSREEWDRNKQDALRNIETILRSEPGNVAIHCHSYHHQQWLAEYIGEDLKSRLIVHTSRDRQARLDDWKRSHGKVFVSVAFAEGQDWKYDVCDAQILLKVPFPDLSDRRVKRRLDLGYHQWYDNQAMLEVIQAYGRAIRAEDDKARFYVVDGSFNRLVKRCWTSMPSWFKEALPQSLMPPTEKWPC
jgi:ATP-dependent DNA helicase DinG